MPNQALIQTLAERLREAERTGEPVAPLRGELSADDASTAYAVQQANVAAWQATGRRVVGRKIGLTSLAVQRQLGVDQPDFGTLFADMIYGDDDPIPMSRTLQPKVEAEVALVLRHGIENTDATVLDVLNAVDYVLPAIEVVGSRIAKWDISYVDTVADNASSGLVVLGAVPMPLAGLDLKGVQMEMRCGDERVSQGTGAACLGHPLNAAVWLARQLAKFGDPLRAGDLVLTGALGPMVAVQPGSTYEVHISGVGTVRAAFANH